MRPSRWLPASLQTTAPPAPPPPWLLRRAPQDLLTTARPRAARRKSRGLEAGQKYLAPTTPRTRVGHRSPGAGHRPITQAPGPSLALAAALPGLAWRLRGCGIHRQSTGVKSPRAGDGAPRLTPACFSARALQSCTSGPAPSAGVATSAAPTRPIVEEEGRDNAGWAGPQPSKET